MIGCYQLALEIMEQPAPDPDLLRQVAGRGWHLAMPAMLPGKDDILYQDLATIYHQLWRRGGLPEPDLIAGAEALLKDLRQRGYLLAIATSRSRGSIERDSQSFGLRDYFHTVRGFDDTKPKPDPAMLYSILQELSVPAEQALMVGDTDTDIQMALSAGVDACGVTSGGLSSHEFDEMGATLVCSDIADLQTFLPPRCAEPARTATPNAAAQAGQLTAEDGSVWLIKTETDTERLLLEYTAFHGYRALGLGATECRMANEITFAIDTQPTFDDELLCLRLTAFIDVQSILENATADLHAEIKEKVAQGFVADCLFANQAMFATPVTSFTFDENSQVCRTAVDTALRVSEDGDINMIDAARDGDLWPKAAFFFGEVSKRDLIAQIDHIEAHRDRLMPKIPATYTDIATSIRSLLDRRLNLLLTYRDRLLQERTHYLAKIAGT